MKHQNTFIIELITFCFGLYFSCFPQNLRAQNQGYFKVLDQTDKIAGSFGEIRSNHFHSGIDYKTDGKEGKPVYAAADGYVSRVKVSSVGYGKALYINHPDGTTSVYAHLRKFYAAIADTLKIRQYTNQSFEQEFFPKEGEFPVKGGQIIGYSGNSGGSDGPHLHFELRNTVTEKPFNPIIKGYKYNDTIAPKIASIVVYNNCKEGSYNYENRVAYTIQDSVSTLRDTIDVNGAFYLGFSVADKAGVEPNSLGISKIRLFRDTSIIFEFSITDFAFDETRMVNSCIDYPYKIDSGKTVIICGVLPGNNLSFWPRNFNELQFKKGETANFKLEASDCNENKKELNCVVHNISEKKGNKEKQGGKQWKFGEKRTIENTNFKASIFENSFFENTTLNITSGDWDSLFFKKHSVYPFSSSIISLQPRNIAINKPIELSIKVNNTTSEVQPKLLLAKTDSLGFISGAGGNFVDGFIKGTIRSMGNYTTVIDTSGPVIQNPTVRIDDYSNKKIIVIPVKDNLSGVAWYKCFMNDNWVPGEYNQQRNEILIYDEEVSFPGPRFRLRIVACDAKENVSEMDIEQEF